MEQGTQKQTHRLSLEGRARMSIVGVTEVISFDEVCVLLKTDCGDMTIDGSGLKIGVLDTDKGVVELGGRIDAVYYSSTNDKGRGRLFRKAR